MLTNPIITAEFRISDNPPVLRITDTTAYGSAGAIHADIIIGLFSINDPSGGLMYQHEAWADTPPMSGDLLPYAASNPTTIKDFVIPVDMATNLPERGNYVIHYRVYINAADTSLNGYYNISITVNLCQEAPAISIAPDIDCIVGKISVKDTTNYGQYTTLSRIFQLYYPAALGLSPETTSQATISAALYTKTYVAKVTSTITYPAGLGSVTVVVEGDVEIPVFCEKSVCDVACQYFTLMDAYEDNIGRNPTLAADQLRRLSAIAIYLDAIQMAQQCGKGNLINEFLDQIYTIGQFTPQGCGCGDDSPQLVSGAGSLGFGNTFSGSGSNGIFVAVNTSGNNSEFHVKINDGLYNVLSGLTKTALTAGSNITITPVVSPDGATTTYTIDATGTSVADGSITTAKLANNAVTTIKITDANITTAKIADGAVTSAKIGTGGVATGNLADGAVTTVKLADSAVTTVKITDGNVTTAKIADSAVISAKIAANTIVAGNIANGAVGTTQLADSGVTTAKIADGNVTTAKLANNAVTTAIITDANVTTTKLADGAVTTVKIADANVTLAKLAANSVDSSKLTSLSVNTANLIDASVTTAKIADGNVTSSKLAGNAVTVAKVSGDLATEFKSYQVSFAAESQGTLQFVNPFGAAVTVLRIKTQVWATLAGTDDATILCSTSTGGMGTITLPMGSAQGVLGTDLVPVTNQIWAPNTNLSFVMNKTTPGGQAVVTVIYQRN